MKRFDLVPYINTAKVHTPSPTFGVTMKFTIAMLSLVISANVFAYSITDSTVLTSASPFLSSASTSAGLQKEEAAAVLNDVQHVEFGKVSPFLAQKIQETQDANAGISAAEALDILINEAQAVLK